MEFPTSPMPSTDSSHGTPKPSLTLSEPTTQPQTQSPTQTTISPNSLIGFKPGEPIKVPASVNPVPPAEEMLVAKATEKRILKMKSDEFYQWQQILGQYQTTIQSTIETALQ
jgi:hypothetical protein